MEPVNTARKRKNAALISSDEETQPGNNLCKNEPAEFINKSNLRERKVIVSQINERKTKKKAKRIVSKFADDSSDEETVQQTSKSNTQKWKRNLESLCNKKRSKNSSYTR